MSEKVLSIYRSKADSLRLETDWIRKRSNWYSAIRLFLFILAIFLVFKFFNVNLTLAITSSLASLILLILIVKLGSRLSARKQMLEELLKINEAEVGVLEWRYDEFDPGFIEFEHKQTKLSVKEELDWIYGR